MSAIFASFYYLYIFGPQEQILVLGGEKSLGCFFLLTSEVVRLCCLKPDIKMC